MKVYYDSSLPGRKKGLPGLPQRTDWQFEYAEAKRRIPAIYRFPKGVVFDVITFLDEVKLRQYFEKYEAVTETLTPLQRRCAKQEHPYQSVPVSEIWLNGKRVEGGYSSSGTISVPWMRQDDKLAIIRDAYSCILKDTACFACDRFCVPYPATDSKMQRLKRLFRLGKVNVFKLATRSLTRFYPIDIHFELAAKEDPGGILLKHPVTGITHSLYFQNAEFVELPLGADRNRSLYAAQLMYEIEPALPEGEALQFNSSIQYTKLPEEKFSPAAASSIGIIGGADGPTAVCVTARNKQKTIPRGLHGLSLHRCISVPCLDKKDTWRFDIEGINIKSYGSKEYNFQ